VLRAPEMQLRADAGSEARYMAAVRRYIRALAPHVAPLMAPAGGPILMIQIETEFGSYASNPAYLDEIRRLWLDCGIDGPFYTEDGLAQIRQKPTTLPRGANSLSKGDAPRKDAARRACSPAAGVARGGFSARRAA